MLHRRLSRGVLIPSSSGKYRYFAFSRIVSSPTYARHRRFVRSTGPTSTHRCSLFDLIKRSCVRRRHAQSAAIASHAAAVAFPTTTAATTSRRLSTTSPTATIGGKLRISSTASTADGKCPRSPVILGRLWSPMSRLLTVQLGHPMMPPHGQHQQFGGGPPMGGFGQPQQPQWGGVSPHHMGGGFGQPPPQHQQQWGGMPPQGQPQQQQQRPRPKGQNSQKQSDVFDLDLFK